MSRKSKKSALGVVLTRRRRNITGFLVMSRLQYRIQLLVITGLILSILLPVFLLSAKVFSGKETPKSTPASETVCLTDKSWSSS